MKNVIGKQAIFNFSRSHIPTGDDRKRDGMTCKITSDSWNDRGNEVISVEFHYPITGFNVLTWSTPKIS